MSKKVRGTIFRAKLQDDPIARQRRCGLFYLHGVNPGAVAAGTAFVEAIEGDKVRAVYEEVHLPEGQSHWPEANRGRLPLPAGVWCEHGGRENGHSVKRIRSFETYRREVMA